MTSAFKLAPYLAIVLLLIGAFFYIKNLGKIQCENDQKTVIIKGIGEREVIEHENKAIKRRNIIKRLGDNDWLRE